MRPNKTIDLNTLRNWDKTRLSLGFLILNLCLACNKSPLSSTIDNQEFPQVEKEAPHPQDQRQPTPNDFFSLLCPNGRIQGGAFDEQLAVSFDQEQKKIHLMIPLSSNRALVKAELLLPSPVFLDSRVLVNASSLSLPTVELDVPLTLFSHTPPSLTLSRLPNGEPIPTIVSGELPSFHLPLDDRKERWATIYWQNSTLGIYVNSDIDPGLRAVFPIRSPDLQRTLGAFGTIPATPFSNGGHLLLFSLPENCLQYLKLEYRPKGNE